MRVVGSGRRRREPRLLARVADAALERERGALLHAHALHQHVELFVAATHQGLPGPLVLGELLRVGRGVHDAHGGQLVLEVDAHRPAATGQPVSPALLRGALQIEDVYLYLFGKGLEACIKGYFLPLLNPLGGLSLIYLIYKYYYYVPTVLAGDIPVGGIFLVPGP